MITCAPHRAQLPCSHAGVERFKRNVSNLGGLMSDVSLELTEWREEEEGETADVKGQQQGQQQQGGGAAPFRLQTKWRFRCVLDLPWRPVLAAAGGTTHVFDEVCVLEPPDIWLLPGTGRRHHLRCTPPPHTIHRPPTPIFTPTSLPVPSPTSPKSKTRRPGRQGHRALHAAHRGVGRATGRRRAGAAQAVCEDPH